MGRAERRRKELEERKRQKKARREAQKQLQEADEQAAIAYLKTIRQLLPWLLSKVKDFRNPKKTKHKVMVNTYGYQVGLLVRRMFMNDVIWALVTVGE